VIRSADCIVDGDGPVLSGNLTCLFLEGGVDPLVHLFVRQRMGDLGAQIEQSARKARKHAHEAVLSHPTSEDYLAFVADSLAAMPVLPVTTSRPGHAPRWADRAFFTQIALDALDETGTGEVLAARLGTRDFPAGLVRLVHDKAEGNPLFVEEIARSLTERGLLVRRNGGVAWAGAAVVDLPATGPGMSPSAAVIG
jgi:hypothetical protein